MSAYTTTTNVSLFYFDETLSLPALLAYRGNENLKIAKSKMNRATDHNYCVGVRLPLKPGLTATLKVYAAKVEIRGLAPLDKVEQLMREALDERLVLYDLKKTKYIDIIFSSFGELKSIAALEKFVFSTLDSPDLVNKNKEIVVKGAFVHVTGIKDPEMLPHV